jgi:hypothetical protein
MRTRFGSANGNIIFIGSLEYYRSSAGHPSGVVSGSPSDLWGRTLVLLYAAVVIAVAADAIGCGSGPITTPPDPGLAPTIVTQPASPSVPMGLTGAFSVAASGSGTLSYQWSDNGAPVSGATAATYTTPATAFANTGESFTVITNSLGSVTSNAVILTVTARAPQVGDLRFQQVDAASTVNGYIGEELSNFSPAIG